MALSLTLLSQAETSWTIQDNCGAGMVGSGSGYSERNADISELLCLPESEYTFTISDAYGDGICCGRSDNLRYLICNVSNFSLKRLRKRLVFADR